MTFFLAAQLIQDLGGPRAVRDLLRKNKALPLEIEIDTIRKWGQRGSIPSDALIGILLAVEDKHGRPLDLRRYVRRPALS